MRMLRRLLVLVLAVCAIGATASAALAETRVALVVGNSAYQSTPVLPNPLNDARDVAAALKSVGFEVVQALDADKAKLDSALRAFADKLGRADVALFFYAGHGLQVGLQNYLLPVDAKLAGERDLEFETVKLDFVLRQMEIDRDGKTTIVILDACRDNPLARNLARSMGTRSASIGRGLAPASTGLGTFIAYSTQPGNVALDGAGRNSPFTAALVKHMGEKGRNLPATMIEVRKDVVAATERQAGAVGPFRPDRRLLLRQGRDFRADGIGGAGACRFQRRPRRPAGAAQEAGGGGEETRDRRRRPAAGIAEAASRQ